MSQIGSVRTAPSLAALVIRAADLSCRLPCAENPWLWFSELPADVELAKAACRGCALRRPCLAGAVERAEACGVWGGEIFNRGVIIAHKRPRGRPSRRPDQSENLASGRSPGPPHERARQPRDAPLAG